MKWFLLMLIWEEQMVSTYLMSLALRLFPAYSQEPNDMVPFMLAETLPGLHRAATGVLDFLPRLPGSASFFNLAGRLSDPNNA